jgi:hypothetical protein
MSRMQEASGAVEYNYAQPANSITPEANNQERPLCVPEPNCCEGSDFGRARRDSGAWIVQHPTSRDERNGAATNKKHELPITPQTSTSGRQGHTHARSRSVRHKAFCRLPLGQNENDSLDAQIRIFKEREDLRKCLIPGMVSGMSQKACEGWQRQATSRSARFLAKIKLGPCKDCKYFSEPSGAPLRRKNRKSQFWIMT